MSVNSSVATSLIPLLQQDVCSRLHTGSRPLVRCAKVIHNPYSKVYVYDIVSGGSPQRVYVKVPHTGSDGGSMALKRLEAEFGILRQLRGADDREGTALPFSAVEPLNLYPQIPALATFEAAPGTLRDHYRRRLRRLFSPGPDRDLTQEVVHCAYWLRDFQHRTAVGTGAFDARSLLNYLQIRLHELVTTGAVPVSQRMADQIIRRVQSLASHIPADTHPLCGRHNDFASHNILVKNGRVWVIDFSMYDTGSSAFDPAYFWLDLEMLKHDPTYSRQAIADLQDQFLQAYGSIRPDDAAFQLVRCQYTLNRILTLHTTSPWPTPANLYRRAVVRSSLAWLNEFSAAA